MKKNRLVERTLDLAGWKFESPLPSEKKAVILAVPHTSNWDGVLLIALAQSAGLRMSFMIKSEWVEGPVGPLMKRAGAVAVVRDRASNMVDQMIAEMNRRDEFILVIPPEGTRSRAEHWKSGFYRIALGAKVPVIPGYLDYGRKRCGLGPAIPMTGDVRADMDRIRAFYAQQQPTAHRPSSYGPIRLREETEAAAAGTGPT